MFIMRNRFGMGLEGEEHMIDQGGENEDEEPDTVAKQDTSEDVNR